MQLNGALPIPTKINFVLLNDLFTFLSVSPIIYMEVIFDNNFSIFVTAPCDFTFPFVIAIIRLSFPLPEFIENIVTIYASDIGFDCAGAIGALDRSF